VEASDRIIGTLEGFFSVRQPHVADVEEFLSFRWLTRLRAGTIASKGSSFESIMTMGFAIFSA